jgi:hypothetical protein
MNRLELLQQWETLAPAEKLGFISRDVQEKAAEYLGYRDELIVPENLEVKETESGIFIFDPNHDHVDVIYVLPHSSVALPTEHASAFHLNHDSTVEAIWANYDMGTPALTSRLLELMAQGKLNYTCGVAWFKWGRAALDPNRLHRHEQTPNRAYRAETVWSGKEDRNALAKRYIDSFILQLETIVQETQPKMIHHIHTYDTYGGGNTAGITDVARAEQKRPAGMFIQDYNHDDGYGVYNPGKRVDLTFLKESHLDVVKATFEAALQPFTQWGEKVEVGQDYPYQAPVMLPGDLSLFLGPDGQQLITEFRKDLCAGPGLDILTNALVQLAQPFK